jgi:hypothetical protein
MFKLKNKVLKLKKHSRSIKKQTGDQSKKNNNLKVIGSVNLSYKSLSLLKNNWRIFMPIIILFFVAFFIFAFSAPSFNFSEFANFNKQITGENITMNQRLNSAAKTLFSFKSTSSSSSSSSTFILLILFSLIFIHAIRSAYNKKTSKARDSIYQGTSGLLSFMSVLASIAIKIIPFAFIGYFVGIGFGGGFFTNIFEKTIALTIFTIVATITVYSIIPNILALYAITNPGTYPMATITACKILLSGLRFKFLIRILTSVLIAVTFYFLFFIVFLTYIPRFTNIATTLFFILLLPYFHTHNFLLYMWLLERNKD